MIEFTVLPPKTWPSSPGPNRVYLVHQTWNDYSYRTLFKLFVYSTQEKKLIDIGHIKIGFAGQDFSISTYDKIEKKFTQISNEFFSLAETPEFYEKLYEIGEQRCKEILKALNCVVVSNVAMNIAKEQEVFQVSLLRDVNINTIQGQFARIIDGDKALEEFDFTFVRENHEFSDLTLEFNVNPTQLPSNNIHALIGRNGLGKTTLLNEMVSSLVGKQKPQSASFRNLYGNVIGSDYFSTVISISFSAFDPFRPMMDQDDPMMGTCYYYIGLKKPRNADDLNDLLQMSELHKKYADSVNRCCSDDSKKELWKKAIRNLESDTNFKDLNLTELTDFEESERVDACIERLQKMSSGHAVVFMTISRLVEVLQDKTLILFDEPEGHLHPPLLSAFLRSLSELLHKRNGVAIMATHSPVVVQEIPQRCCWVLTRFGDATHYARPSIETFAENVGVITKEVFKLEMERSGFHKLFQEKVNEGYSYEEIFEIFRGGIGREGKAILMAMLMLRDKNNGEQEGKNA